LRASDAHDPRPPVQPLDVHLGHLDRVLVRERVTRLLEQLQRRRDLEEERLQALGY
jgi:hypothetical protein